MNERERNRGLIKALASVAMSRCELKRTIGALIHAVMRMLDEYPDKRVVRLALSHPKERVRKKNRNRIIKWMKLQYKRKGGESDG